MSVEPDGTAERIGRGKWALAGFPHRGWSCIGVSDLEEPRATCEMCESTTIRYVHHMIHDEYEDGLDVGCVCAEHMEQDYVGPRLREDRLRKRAQRLRTWVGREWSRSDAGNIFLRTEGLVVVIYRFHDGWRVRVSDRASDRTQAGSRLHPTVKAAKLAALDAVMWAKERWK